MNDQLFVKDVVGGVPVRDRIRTTDIDDTGLTGFSARTTTEVSIAIGTVQSIVLNLDDDRLKPGCVGQLTFDRDTWLWGLVMGKSTTDGQVTIKFAGLRKSTATLSARDFLFELRSGPMLGFSPDATIGLSERAMTVPAIGQTFTDNIRAGLYVSRNMTLLYSDAENFDNNFRVRVLSYDETTGDGEFICNGRNDITGASSTIWIVSLIPGAVSGASAPVTSVTKIDSATAQTTSGGAQTVSLTAPATIQAGDLLVWACRAFGGAVGAGIPSGFSTVSLSPLLSLTARTVVATKLADGTEAGATLTGFSQVSGGDILAQLTVFRPDTPAASIVTASVAVQSASGTGDLPAEVIASGSGAAPLIAFGVYGAHFTGLTRTMTPAASGETAQVMSGGISPGELYLKWKIYNTAPADVTVDMSDASATYATLQSFYVELHGAPAEPGDAVVFEDDGSGNPLYPAADGSQIDLSANPDVTAAIAALATQLPKVLLRATVTPTLLNGNISSVDFATTDTIVWSQNLRTQVGGGDYFTIIPAVGGTWPTASTTRGLLYGRFNTGSNDTFSLHLTLADAKAQTNKINLTAAGSGTRTAQTLVLSSVGPNLGLDPYCPIGGSGTYETTLGFCVNFDAALADANYLIDVNVNGVVASTTTHSGSNTIPNPNATSTTQATYRGQVGALPVMSTITQAVDSAFNVEVNPAGKALFQPTTWAGQSAWTITVKAWR